MNYPIENIREQFPALSRIYAGKQVAYFDGPGGSQVVKGAIDAINKYMTDGGANIGGKFITSLETSQYISDARDAMADFIGCKPNEIAFGQNMTSLTFQISRALSRNWKRGDNIVVTELDHRANVDPWILAAKDSSVNINWIRMKDFVLDTSNLDEIINEKTRLVAVTYASNGVGTVPELDKIISKAREFNVIVVLDAVHGAPHLFIDRDELDVDIVLCSAYKFFGPHIGVVAIREEIFEGLNNYKVRPASNRIPSRLETGTQNHEAIASIPAVIDFIAGIGEGETRRERLKSAFDITGEYEDMLANRLRDALSELDKVKVFQSDTRKTPTIAFVIDGVPNDIATDKMAEEGLFIGNGHFYADTIAEVLGIDGWIRIGIAPYNTIEEVDRLITVIRELCVSI